MAVGQAVGSFFGGPAATYRYRAAVIGATSVAGGVCAFLCFTVDFQMWVAVAVATVGGGLLGLTMPVLVAASTEYSGDSKSSGASIMGVSNQSGGVVGAAIAGAILAGTGYVGIGYFCLAVTLFSGLAALLLGRNLRIGSD